VAGGNLLASWRLNLRRGKVGGKVRRPVGPDAERLTVPVSALRRRYSTASEY
jgi:hypothetical protein